MSICISCSTCVAVLGTLYDQWSRNIIHLIYETLSVDLKARIADKNINKFQKLKLYN